MPGGGLAPRVVSIWRQSNQPVNRVRVRCFSKTSELVDLLELLKWPEGTSSSATSSRLPKACLRSLVASSAPPVEPWSSASRFGRVMCAAAQQPLDLQNVSQI